MGYVEEENIAEQKPLIAEPSPAVAAPVGAVEDEGKWSTGLCDCCAYPGGGALACVSMFLPCVQYGVLAEQLPQGSTWVKGSFCGAACAFMALDFLASLAHCSLWPGVNIVPTSALLHMEMRRFLRTKYGIRGSWLGDLCTTWWCGPCALMQETRELILRAQEVPSGAVSGAPGAPGAAPQQQPQLLGYMFVTPSAAPPSAPVMTPPPSVHPTYIVGGIVVPELAPATGVPVPYNAVPRTHVATVTLPAPPSKDTAMPASAN